MESNSNLYLISIFIKNKIRIVYVNVTKSKNIYGPCNKKLKSMKPIKYSRISNLGKVFWIYMLHRLLHIQEYQRILVNLKMMKIFYRLHMLFVFCYTHRKYFCVVSHHFFICILNCKCCECKQSLIVSIKK